MGVYHRVSYEFEFFSRQVFETYLVALVTVLRPRSSDQGSTNADIALINRSFLEISIRCHV